MSHSSNGLPNVRLGSLKGSAHYGIYPFSYLLTGFCSVHCAGIFMACMWYRKISSPIALCEGLVPT